MDHLLKTLDYTLTGTGWAEMVIADDDACVSITISYACEPIPEIIDALIRLYKHESLLEFIHLDGEGTDTVLLLTVVNDNHVMRLEVIEDAYFDQVDPCDKTRKPMPVFTTYVFVWDFFNMFKEAMNKLVEKGLGKYKDRWCSEFPMEAFKKML